MSHGGSGAEKADPNLIPLLDLVFQLIMFFMVCVNFVNEQIKESIKLPVAQSARPMDKRETDLLYLNLNSEGKLEVPGREQPFTTLLDMKFYLRSQYEDAQRTSRERGEGGKVNTGIVIRADQSVDYRDVYQLMRACREVGYRKLQIRAKTKGATPT
jgi:biopolymer transport protein ExbD